MSLSCRAPELGLRGLGLLQLMEPLGLWRQLRPESLVDSGGSVTGGSDSVLCWGSLCLPSLLKDRGPSGQVC